LSFTKHKGQQLARYTEKEFNMSKSGFIISLDNQTDTGLRKNWCTTQAWWTNQSNQFSRTSNNVTANVGENAIIQVEARGTFLGEQQAFTLECKVNSIQAWVCYPNTVTGATSKNLIVSSMNPNNPNRSPAPTLSARAICFTGTPDDTSPVTTGFLNLSPAWVPTNEDLLPPNNTGHVCVIATSAGIFDVNGDALPVGISIANDDLS
jgi:hypothetical protein